MDPRREVERRTARTAWRRGALAALASLAAVAAGCAESPARPDGGSPLDAPTIEGGTIRPDAAWSDAALDGGSADAGARCPGICDPRVMGGCGLGDACVLRAGQTTCVAETDVGVRAENEACTSARECGSGLACFRDRVSGTGVCRPVCCPLDGGGCASGQICGGSGMLVGGETTDWGECGPPRACNVLDPSLDCADREGCYIVDATGTTECRIAGAAAAGAPCERSEDCQAGLFCGGIGTQTCLVVCELAATRPCPVGSRCVAQSYSPAGSGICIRDMLAP